MRCPGLVDLSAMGDQPTADHRLGEPSAIFSRRCRGKIAKPGEALQLLCRSARSANLREIHIGEAERVAADLQPAREQGVTALAVALDMVARHGCQLERLARAFQSGKKRAAGEL